MSNVSEDLLGTFTRFHRCHKTYCADRHPSTTRNLDNVGFRSGWLYSKQEPAEVAVGDLERLLGRANCGAGQEARADYGFHQFWPWIQAVVR